MGIGYVVMAPREDYDNITTICEEYGIGCLEIGDVEKGPKQVIIEPKNIVYH
jgi:phosphoribosylaminoimidazole (AIR) synthetase